jgi:hypothetical protein
MPDITGLPVAALRQWIPTSQKANSRASSEIPGSLLLESASSDKARGPNHAERLVLGENIEIAGESRMRLDASTPRR